jgi:hypothetical protein
MKSVSSILTACLLALSSPVEARSETRDDGTPLKVLLVGDSWAEKAGKPFEAVLKKNGSPLEVVNKGIGGSTAQQWAHDKNSVRDLVTMAGGEAEVAYIWVSVGGNDAQDDLPGCQLAGGSRDKCVQQCIDQVITDTRTFLDPVVAKYPNIKIFQFGYDILNFGENLECKAKGLALFPSCLGETSCINTEFIKLQYNYVEVLTQNYSQHTALNILGTLQHSGGIANATTGHPDLSSWSPSKLMETNCIHASQEGFEIIFQQVYDMYIVNQTLEH